MPRYSTAQASSPAVPDKLKLIGQRLRVIRQAVGLTQQEISDLLEIDQSTWTKWERGQRTPEVFTMIQFAARAMVTLDMIFRGNPDGIHPDMKKWLLASAPRLLSPDPTDKDRDTDKALAAYRTAISPDFRPPSVQ